MKVEPQKDPQLTRVAELVEDIKFAMLTTAESDGTLRSRPMATLHMDGDGNLWFFTAASSPKVEETEQHRLVNLSYARIDRQDYVSISGSATLVRDKEKMNALWTPWVKAWFPKGIDDPDLALLKVTVEEAEYWDSPGNPVIRAYGLAKAIALGNTDSLGDHKKITL